MSGNPQEEVEPFSIWFYMKMYETIVFFLFVFNYLLIYVNYRIDYSYTLFKFDIVILDIILYLIYLNLYLYIHYVYAWYFKWYIYCVNHTREINIIYNYGA